LPAEPSDRSARSAAEDLRAEGHRLIDRMADYLASVERRPVSTRLTPAAIDQRFAGALPTEGRAAKEVWDETWSAVVDDAIHLAHPMYMGHQVAPPLPHAVLADAMASLLNQSVAVWEMSPTGTPLEARVMSWLAEILGYPDTADGTFVSGGSAANLTGLLAAREACFPGVGRRGIAGTGGAGRATLLVAEHAHYCIARAAHVMGLGAASIRTIGGPDGRMGTTELRAGIRAVRASGGVPMAVVATGGSTATGRFDPIDAIADVAGEEGVWLHVDAAHGASFLLSDRLRGLLRGLERADSVAWDPHKMMWMPISLGAVLVRDRRHLDAAFEQNAPYLFHVRPGEERSRDAGVRTLQCSRRLDALKLWVCLQHYGARHFAELAEHTVDVTRYLFDRISAEPDFEPMHEPDCNILCFRHIPERLHGASTERIDAFQSELRARYNASGVGWITATVLDGRRTLRVTLINPHTATSHVDRLIDGLRATADLMDV